MVAVQRKQHYIAVLSQPRISLFDNVYNNTRHPC
jgi:hypothetical protein